MYILNKTIDSTEDYFIISDSKKRTLLLVDELIKLGFNERFVSMFKEPNYTCMILMNNYIHPRTIGEILMYKEKIIDINRFFSNQKYNTRKCIKIVGRES